MPILVWGWVHDSIIAYHSFVNWTVPPLIGGFPRAAFAPGLKTPNFPNLQSVTQGSHIIRRYKKITAHI